jgi:8-oxo-dGTP pyrophosphatase MutT (NUDIX family)
MSRIPDRLYRVIRLETAYRPQPWDFAERETARIDAHWARALAEKPKMFDGKVLLLRDAEIVASADGDIFRGAFFDTNFRNFHAWLAFGAGDGAYNCFAMAALRSSDGAFLLGEMSSHTMNAGQVYFPAGTPDRDDIFGESVDLAASVSREMEEETGFAHDDAPPAPGWTLIVSGAKIACMQERLLPHTAAQAAERFNAFIARDPDPELVRLHPAFGPNDIDKNRMPEFIQTYLANAFANPFSNPFSLGGRRRRAEGETDEGAPAA